MFLWQGLYQLTHLFDTLKYYCLNTNLIKHNVRAANSAHCPTTFSKAVGMYWELFKIITIEFYLRLSEHDKIEEILEAEEDMSKIGLPVFIYTGAV